MRVLHLVTEQSWRGGENQVRLLLEGLKNKGVQSFVVVQPNSGAAQRFSYLPECLPIRMRNDLDLIAAWRLASLCKAQKIDLIDAHSARGHALGLLARVLVPQVRLVVHRRVESRFTPSWANRLKYGSRQVDRYVAISHAIADQMVSSGVDASLVRVVHSAVPVPPMADRVTLRERLLTLCGFDPSTILFGTASALTKEKDLPTFLKAFARLVKREQPVSAVITGDGADRRSLESLAAELEITRQVAFLGFRDDVPDVLGGLNVFVLPSRSEGLGTILLDAQLAGAAVVASRTGGIPEAVLDGTTGLLFEPGNVDELETLLGRMADDLALRMRLTEQGRQRVIHEFSVDRMVEGNWAVYREVVGRSTPQKRPDTPINT